jgi:DNA-binding NtrC family response regulator
MNKEMRILVVDDDWPMAKTLVDVLRLNRYRAEAAYSGPQALEMVGDDQFDCVLTDIKMPEVTGVDLLRDIKEVRPHVPVVFMTAYAAGSLVKEGLREGALASFVKPLDIDLLLSCLSVLNEQRSIVVIDDDAKFWRVMGEGLERRGFTILKVEDPGDLLEVLKPNGRAVFLGTRLNGVKGLELLERIREQYDTLPVVLATDGPEATSSESEKAQSLNVFAYLHKPFEADELLGVLADIRRREVETLLRRRTGALVGQVA